MARALQDMKSAFFALAFLHSFSLFQDREREWERVEDLPQHWHFYLCSFARSLVRNVYLFIKFLVLLMEQVVNIFLGGFFRMKCMCMCVQLAFPIGYMTVYFSSFRARVTMMATMAGDDDDNDDKISTHVQGLSHNKWQDIIFRGRENANDEQLLI